MLRLIQLRNGNIRKVGVIDEPRIKLLSEFASIYELARAAINSRAKTFRGWPAMSSPRSKAVL